VAAGKLQQIADIDNRHLTAPSNCKCHIRKEPMKLDLSHVTICAADCSMPNLAAHALRLSTTRCDFGDALLLTDQSITDPDFRTIQIDSLRSKNDYSRFIQLQLPEFISTPYLLLIQWDG
jgi:hypothetical protein